MSEWKNYCIGDLCSTISNTYNGSDDKVVLINTSDVLDGKVLNHNFVENKNLKGQFKKTFIKNDILYSEIRPANKRFAFIDFDKTNNYIVSTKLMVLRPDTTKVLPSFLFSILKSQTVIDELQHLAETRSGTFPQITFSSELAPMKVLLPNLDIQAKIVSILYSIEEKISTNTAINNNLEKQAQAIFKSWFVDFEPFGGTMPENWSYIQLSDLATFVGGYSYKGTELQTSNCAMATIKNFDRNGGFKLDGFKEIIPSEKLKISQEVDLFDILVAHTDLTQNAEVIGNAELLLSKLNYKKIIFSMDLVKVVPNKGISKFLLATLLKSKLFKSHCLGYVNGTTVLHLSKKALPEYSFAFPNNIEGIKNISSILESMYIRIANNINENMNLTQLRDTLLPKLMNGEIDVSKVDIPAYKLLFSILVFEHLYIKIVILIGVTINTMTIFTSNIIKFKLKKSFTFDN